MLRHVAAFSLVVLIGIVGCGPDSSRTDATGTTASAAPVEPASIGAIPHLTRAGDLYMAGQPGQDDFTALDRAGVTEVVDLRKPSEARGFDEATVAGSAGLSYVSIPFDGPDELTDAVFDRVRETLESAEGPVLMHCASSNRVGTVWLPYRVLDEGVDLERAVADAKAAGMRSQAYEAKARDYIARHR